MKRSLVLGLVGTLTLAAAGCGLKDGDDFAGSTPTAETVALSVPGNGTAQGALTTNAAVRSSALRGQLADSYQLTRGVTAVMNGATAWVLILVKTIVAFPPTRVDGDTGVWGPHSEPLDRNAWRLTVTRADRNVFEWKFDAKAKNADDSTFVTILSGMHTRAVDAAGHPVENFGNGTFTIDWQAARALPDHKEDEYGSATFTYAWPSLLAMRTVNIDFHGVRHDRTGEFFNAVYRFTATAGAGGDLKYGEVRDSLPDPGNTGSAAETLTLHSRWQETGAGRSDYRVEGTDVTTALGGPATVSECWDTGFLSQYKVVSYDPGMNWGAETSCAFATADFSAVTP